MRTVRCSGHLEEGRVFGLGGLCPDTPCEQNDWQTGVKTLPFRNILLQTVKIARHSNGRQDLLSSGHNPREFSIENNLFIGEKWDNKTFCPVNKQ